MIVALHGNRFVVVTRKAVRGVSRNPAILMGPPHYADVHFAVPPGHSVHAIKLKYLL